MVSRGHSLIDQFIFPATGELSAAMASVVAWSAEGYGYLSRCTAEGGGGGATRYNTLMQLIKYDIIQCITMHASVQ